MVPSPLMSAGPRSIGILGGGTAGYFAALAIKRRFPRFAVTVVESSAHPIIGVGEGTTTLMPPFLHGQLGLSIEELFRAVGPTLKLGIRFEWGLPGEHRFNYPFGDAEPCAARFFDGDLRSQSLISMLMSEGRGPVVRGPEGQLLSLLTRLKFAYHLDNAPFVAFLAKAAVDAGIEHLDLTVEEVVRAGDGSVRELRGASGRTLSCDFYVDASGFRSELLGKAFGVGFESYASSLPCDRAVVATAPQGEAIDPHTTTSTMAAGWAWRIPMRGIDHCGYVFDSDHLSDDAAFAELRAHAPGARASRVIRYRSGRHRRFWASNVAAVGNAYGFVEPLQATALHMVIIELAYLLAGLETLGDPAAQAGFVDSANEAVGAHWDYLRWFLAAHYKFNRRCNTPFWARARADVDVSGLDPFLASLSSYGAGGGRQRRFAAGDPAFGPSGMMTVLLGQRVDADFPTHGAFTPQGWAERVAKDRRVLSHALPHREVLALLDEQPAMLRRFVDHPSSWCGADRVHVERSGGASLVVGPHGGALPR